MGRLVGVIETAPDDGLLLVGRRHLRSNNSWMHNLEVLTKGKPRCTLHVPDCDAAMPQLRAVNKNHDARCILVQ